MKCFAKCRFKFSEPDSDSTEDSAVHDDIDDYVPLKLVSLAHELFGCDFSELVELEQAIPTCDKNIKDWDKPASELLKEFGNDTETVSDYSDDENESAQTDPPVCTLNEVEEYIVPG